MDAGLPMNGHGKIPKGMIGEIHISLLIWFRGFGVMSISPEFSCQRHKTCLSFFAPERQSLFKRETDRGSRSGGGRRQHFREIKK
jgi:hypothetical protein